MGLLLSAGDKKPRIVVVGSSNTDMVVKIPHLPSPGETVLGGEFRMVAGGKGANQAVAAARLGAKVLFITRLGMDLFGDNTLRNFESEGIDTRFIVRDPDFPSGVALILVDDEGENMIAVAPGANSKLSPSDVEVAEEEISLYSVMVLQLEIPLETVISAARMARQKGLKVILNPAPACLRGLPPELLKEVDILVPNESEARALLGLKADVIDESWAPQLLELGPKAVVVTLGARGSLVVTYERVWNVPAPRVKAVDSTAAGDAFTGALAVAIAEGQELGASVEFANKVAAISVTRMGAQSSLPTADEVKSFHDLLL
jgi:ribokinase